MRRLLWAAVAVSLPFLVGSSCKQQNVTAPSLQATCEARPATGSAPLPVSFALSVAGAQGPFTVAIVSGDGATGRDPDATHTYAVAGSFVASFTVNTATQSARCSATVAVSGESGPPSPAGDQPPVAVFKTDPVAHNDTLSGTAPFTVRFNMCASSDPENDTLWFTMDFDGDGAVDVHGTTGAHCRRDFTYAAGTWDAHLCVHDVGPELEPLHPSQCHTYRVVAKP